MSRTIFRSQLSRDFTTLPNAMLRDKALSFRARGVLAMVLSNSNEWEVTKAWLNEQGPEGRDAIVTALNELREAGYCKVRKEREEGKFSRTVWEFYDCRQDEVSNSPQPEKPATVKPAPVKPATENPQQRKTIKQEKRSEPKDNSKRAFVKPEIHEVEAFAKELGLPEADGTAFFYAKEGNGWMSGQNRVKDWKATMRTWKLNGWMASQKQQTNGHNQSNRPTNPGYSRPLTGAEQRQVGIPEVNGGRSLWSIIQEREAAARAREAAADGVAAEEVQPGCESEGDTSNG